MHYIAMILFIWLCWVFSYMQHQIACPSRCIIALVLFVWLFPTVCLKMSPQRACLSRSEATLHCWNSRVRILFEDTVIVRAWQMDLKHENICLIFLSWNIWSAGFVSFLLTCPPKKSTSFLQAAAYLNCNLFYSKSSINSWRYSTGPKYSGYKRRLCMYFQICPQSAFPRECKRILFEFVCLFSTVFSNAFPQSLCLRGCKVTLVAFVQLFSTVCFKMCPQIACLRGCIITLVAFVRLFSTTSFQMFSQIVCMRRCKIKLVVLLEFFSSVCFEMYS